jgi:hypothetical protein
VDTGCQGGQGPPRAVAPSEDEEEEEGGPGPITYVHLNAPNQISFLNTSEKNIKSL